MRSARAGAHWESFPSWQFTEEEKERNIGQNLSLQYLPKSRSRLPFMQFGQDSLGHFTTFQCRPYLSFSADKEQLGTNRIFWGTRSPDEMHLFHPASICSSRDGEKERERGGYSRCYPCVTVPVFILGNLIIAAISSTRTVFVTNAG